MTATINDTFCDQCEEFRPAREVSRVIDPVYGRDHGSQCQDCAERAYERSLSDYYGGSGPQTGTERYAADAALSRSLR